MYSWLVFFHVLGTFAFLFGHGVSAMVALRLRYVRNFGAGPGTARPFDVRPGRAIRVDPSAAHNRCMGRFQRRLVGQWVDMGFPGPPVGHNCLYVCSSNSLLSKSASGCGAEHNTIIHGTRVEQPPPADEEVLADLLASSRPFWLTGVGLGGFVVILWLMMFKPF